MHKTVFNSLDEILEFIRSTHTHINKPAGVYCLKLWKQPDGTRVPIEELKGVRIKNFSVYNKNTVIIHQVSHGSSGGAKSFHMFEATTYLPELAMINVYDYSAEFLSTTCLDFAYLEQTKGAKIVFLSEFIHNVQQNLRAQWFRDKETEELMSEVGLGPRLRQSIQMDRYLDLDF